MTPTWLDITLFTGAVYGIAWTITKSKLFRSIRGYASRLRFLDQLLSCLVCTAAWVGLGLSLLLPTSTLFSIGFRAQTVSDCLILVGWSIASSWCIGRLLGDVWLDPEPKSRS